MFQDIFEASPDAMIVVDTDGSITLANCRADQLFGFGEGELVGVPVEALVPASVRSAHRTHRQHYMATPRMRPMGSTGMRLTGRRRDGTEFPVEIGLSPLRTTTGMCFLASIRDVSQSQRMRDAVVRMHYDAVVSRLGQLTLESSGVDIVERTPALLAETLDIDAVAIMLIEPHGERCEVRAAVGLDTTAYDAQSWVDSPDSALIRVLTSAQPQVVNNATDTSDASASIPLADIRSYAMVPLLDRGRPMGALVALSRQARRFNHDAQHLLLSTANLLSALLQRNRSEEQLAHAQRLDALGQLTGGIAHDFNNLLTVMSGNLQLLEEECHRLPTATATIAAALRSVERGAELTSKLLAFARRQRLRPRPLDARVLLRDLQLMLGRTLSGSIRLKLDCADDLPDIYADSAQLEAGLLNLVLNARDAMPRGGRIEIRAREQHVEQQQDGPAPGRYVLISVIDTGRGMLPEVKARALEPFFTTKPPGQGSGLGLSMVYGFARQSGGHLSLESRLGYGTRVDLYLPVSAVAATAAAAPTPRIAISAGHVLVVEDEPAVRKVAARFLRSLGYRVTAVASAGKALEALAKEPGFALLFTDVMLGSGMTGTDLATAARARHPGLPVLLTSGFTPPDDAQAGGFELLPKPYRRDQLAAAVQRCLAG